MRKLYLLPAVLLLSFAAWAQEHYTEGPVWRVQLIRVKPGKMDAYLTSIRESSKPLLDEQKKQGLIMDYKVFLKETKANPEDWDIALAVQFKNHAAMDGATAKNEVIRDKVMGGKSQAQSVTDKRLDMREVISSELMQEILLK